MEVAARDIPEGWGCKISTRAVINIDVKCNSAARERVQAYQIGGDNNWGETLRSRGYPLGGI